jgi:hypothetical protein
MRQLVSASTRHPPSTGVHPFNGVVPKNADAGSVAHVADAASIGVTSKGYPKLTDALAIRRNIDWRRTIGVCVHERLPTVLGRGSDSQWQASVTK